MSAVRKVITSGVLAAFLVSTASPALARGPYVSGGIGWSSGWGGHGHGWGRRHRDRVDAGDVLAGVAILGVFAAIASSASKAKRDRVEPSRDDGYPPRNSERTDDDRRGAGTIRSEEAAVDACAIAAEERLGDAASVRDITSVASVADGWDVNGVIEDRSDWRDKEGDRRRFSCSVRDGMVDRVTVDQGAVAFAD